MQDDFVGVFMNKKLSICLLIFFLLGDGLLKKEKTDMSGCFLLLFLEGTEDIIYFR